MAFQAGRDVCRCGGGEAEGVGCGGGHVRDMRSGRIGMLIMAKVMLIPADSPLVRTLDQKEQESVVAAE